MIAQLYIDIETIPAQRPDVLAEIREAEAESLAAALEAVRPPGNYKKQETIDEWMATEAPKIKQKLIDDSTAKVEEAYRKTGLDGSFGHIACVSFAYLDSEPEKLWTADWQDPSYERDLLMGLEDLLNDHIPTNMHRAVQVVGHNVAGFDLRFLVQRSIITGVRPHPIINAAAQAKPWELDRVYDTMIQWAGVGKTVSLDKLCKALGMPGKGDLDGSKVWDAIKNGRIAEVAEYCADDVRKVRAVHQRMTFQTAPTVQQFEDVPA
jgi:3'-5' exonuclease